MRRKATDSSTLVVKLGMEFFTTEERPSMEPVDIPCHPDSPAAKSPKKHKGSKKNGRFYKFVRRHFLQRKHAQNDVREIHIVPDGDELRWARRSAGSAASRSSDETGSSEDDRLEVVHDMAEEYNSES